MLIFGANIPDIAIILLMEGLGGSAFLVFNFVNNKNKFTALICEKYIDTYRIKKKLKVPLQSTSFKWKMFAYNVAFDKCIIDDKNKPIIYYLYHGAKPIFPLSGITIKEDAQVFKIVTDGRIMQHLGERKMSRTYMYIILALIIVIGVVGVFSMYSIQQNNKDIFQLTRELMNVTKSLIPENPVVIK